VSQTPATDVKLLDSGAEAKVNSKVKRDAGLRGTGEIQGKTGLLATSPPQYVSFYSDASDRPKNVLATYRLDMKDNWISLRVVNRLNLTSRQYAPVKEAVFDGKPLTSTGQFVEFTCCEKQSRKGIRCRFYIAKHPDFDILFGTDLLRRATIQPGQGG